MVLKIADEGPIAQIPRRVLRQSQAMPDRPCHPAGRAVTARLRGTRPRGRRRPGISCPLQRSLYLVQEMPGYPRGGDLTYGRIMVPASSLLARWGKVPERDRCIGCHLCTTAARVRTRSRSGWRTYVKSVDIGVLLQARHVFQVTGCDQCTEGALCDGLPDPGDVPPRGRPRRFRQGNLHRLRGVHGRVPCLARPLNKSPPPQQEPVRIGIDRAVEAPTGTTHDWG